MKNSRYLPLAAFLALSLLWGSEWVLTASLSPQPVLLALTIRYGVAAVFLMPWVLRHRTWRKSVGDLCHAAGVGFGILCLPQLFIFVANQNISPTLSLAAMAAVPVLLAVSGRGGITTAVCGLAGILFLSRDGLGISVHQTPWLLLPTAAAAVLALTLVGAEAHLHELSIAEALFVQCVVAAVSFGIASLVLERQAISWSVAAAIGIAVNALLTALCGYLIFYWLLGKLGAARVSMLQWTQALVATAESAALMHIRPGWGVVAGALLIVIALTLAFSNGNEDGGVMLQVTPR